MAEKNKELKTSRNENFKMSQLAQFSINFQNSNSYLLEIMCRIGSEAHMNDFLQF